jgi:purine-binding chemotaxis protein CheW
MDVAVFGSCQVVVFDLDDEQYAVEISQVREIIRYAPPRSVSGADTCVRGVINLRGRILPVIDLRTRLGLAGAGDPASAKIVVIESDAATAGLIVDDVRSVTTLGGLDSVEALPDLAGSGRFIVAVARVDATLVLVLDPAALLALSSGVDAPDTLADAA